jgi:hypothetical protein
MMSDRPPQNTPTSPPQEIGPEIEQAQAVTLPPPRLTTVLASLPYVEIGILATIIALVHLKADNDIVKMVIGLFVLIRAGGKLAKLKGIIQ